MTRSYLPNTQFANRLWRMQKRVKSAQIGLKIRYIRHEEKG